VTVAARAALYFPGETAYIEQSASDYPEKGIANWEEARCLFSELGYNILDIRSEWEIDSVGNFPRELPSDHKSGAKIYTVPLINARAQYDSDAGKKVVKDQQPNRDFMNQVKKIFPDTNAKIIICCSDGRNRAIQALEALDEAGYVNIVGLRGGYNMWNRTWDAKLRRRNLPGDFQEEYQHGADGCGVHATGASFQNQDAFQYPDWKDDTDWIDWSA
jgi:rhodanese-related sulfurtransferase